MTDEDDARDPEVGSLVEEATKLFTAVSGWAREHGSEAGHGLGGLADQVAHAAHDADEHLATGSAECTVCPVCRTVHAVRRLNPEVKAHLAVAASSLVQAAAGVLATVVPQPEDDSRQPRGSRASKDPVEKIVLDETVPDEDQPEEDA